MAKIGTKYTIKSIRLGQNAVALEAMTRYGLKADEIALEMHDTVSRAYFDKFVNWMQEQLQEALRDA